MTNAEAQCGLLRLRDRYARAKAKHDRLIARARSSFGKQEAAIRTALWPILLTLSGGGERELKAAMCKVYSIQIGTNEHTNT